MQRELRVYLDLDGKPILVGRLWARERSGRESSSFAYETDWLARKGAFALSPTLPLARGQFHTTKGLSNVFTDTAPDSWGRKLMQRRERARARKAKSQPRSLFEIDYLAGVDDQTRMGALRFKDEESEEFLTTTGEPVPPLIDLPRLLSATDRIERDKETDEDLLLVLAPGTSLGGARPKATVRDKDGDLLIAKFPKRDDDWPVTAWEAVLLDLAGRGGLTTPDWRLERIARKSVLLMKRFDRGPTNRRIPFMSALTALDASDHGEQRSYLELVDVLRQMGSKPDADLDELWRRMVFNILVSNTDDHLRNHAFLHDGIGWRLSPVFDLNPTPKDVKPRVLTLAINEDDATASLETAMSVAVQFGLKSNRARSLAGEVATAVATWKDTAKSMGVTGAQVERMQSAFDHDDLRDALTFVKTVRSAPAKAVKPKAPKAALRTMPGGRPRSSKAGKNAPSGPGKKRA